MKKVLIITYYWPPGSGPGVQRFLKFSKYLHEFGWDPIILTVENGSYPSTDTSLIKDILDDLKVFKTKTFEPFHLYNILKGKKGKSIGVGDSRYAGAKVGFKGLPCLLEQIILFQMLEKDGKNTL